MNNILRHRSFVLIAGLSILMGACNLPALSAGPRGPRAWIDVPLDGSALPLAPVEVISHASDDSGVAEMELYVNDEQVRVDAAIAEGQLVSFNQLWSPQSEGQYTLYVLARNPNGGVGQSDPIRVTIGQAPPEDDVPMEITPTATSTAATLTPTAPSEEAGGPPEATFETGAFCRQGPATAYPDVISVAAGVLANIEGRSESLPLWWYIYIPAFDLRCWASGSVVGTTGETDDVPVLAAPPLPITNTPTPTSTPAPPSAPDTPGGLNITNSVCVTNGPGKGLEVSLAWTDNANNEDGYRVYRNGGLLATLGVNAISYTDDASNTASPYTYNVEAFNAVGSSTAISVQSAVCPEG